jgi:hypothetical protein
VAVIASYGLLPSRPRLQSGAAAQADSGDRLMAKVPTSRRPLPAAGALSKWTTGTATSSILSKRRTSPWVSPKVKSLLTVRYGERDGSACAEFSWEGLDENDPPASRMGYDRHTAGRLVGHFYTIMATIQPSFAKRG